MDETENMMVELRAELGPPPNMKEGGSMADALAAYLEYSDENIMNIILEILGNYSGNNTVGKCILGQPPRKKYETNPMLLTLKQ